MDLITRLQGVRKTGRESWAARCPAHEDKSPSLSVKRLDDGRTLLHCFAGCSTESVLASLGMEMADLFPDKLGDLPRSRGFTAMDALRTLEAEVAIVMLVAADVLDKKPVIESDYDRLALAVQRIGEAMRTVRA